MAELVGTMFLIVLGDGVVAAVVLAKAKRRIPAGLSLRRDGPGGGMGVYARAHQRRHIESCVTLGLAVIGKFSWHDVPDISCRPAPRSLPRRDVVWLAYLAHWAVDGRAGKETGVFSTAPAIRKLQLNLLTEIIGTFVLVFGVLAIVANKAPGKAGLRRC